jgi:hypothetical protein
VGVRVRMNMDDSRLIASFQLLITEMLIEKRLGQRRPGLTDELYQTWLEVEQRGLKKTPEYRSARFVARRIGDAQQPKCCVTPLFKRNRAHRHAECRGVTVDGNRGCGCDWPVWPRLSRGCDG